MPPLTGQALQIYLRKLHMDLAHFPPPTVLLFILTLTFDQNLHSGHHLWTAVSIPVAQSLFCIGNLRKIPAMLADEDFQLAVLVVLALPSILTVYCTTVAEPSPIWEIGLYLSYAAWGACVERAFELPPFLSFIYFVLMLTFAVSPSSTLPANREG